MRRRSKNQRPYQVRLLQLDSGGKVTGGVIASRDFKAVDVTGARRAAAHWYKALYPDDPVAGAHTPWQVQSPHASESRIEYHYCTTSHGLLAVHATDGKDVKQAKVEEEVAEADQNEIMRRLTANPQEVKKQYRGRSAVLLGIMEHYFRINCPIGYSRLYEKGLLEADIVYDWPGVPEMLARAWDTKPRHIRSLLQKLAIVECPFCGKQIEYEADRTPGGFESSLVNTPCPICHTPMIEINSSALSSVSDKWRTAQSPYFVAPNPEQERDWSIKRLTLALNNPTRYFVVGSVRTGSPIDQYHTFIEQVIRRIQPGARIVRYPVSRMKESRAEKVRAFFKTWAAILGEDSLANTKQREPFVYDKIRAAADWLIIDGAEHLGDDLQRRLRGLDYDRASRPHWEQIPMVWVQNYDYSCECLGGYRRTSLWYPHNKDTSPSPQVLWLPDPEQLDI